MPTPSTSDIVFAIRADDKTRAAFDSARKNMRGLVQDVGRNTQLSTQQLANMQFQLQDIAVSLSSGQSPFRVMLQQGSQVVQMFKSGTGLKAAIAEVGAGIGTFLLNPLNLGLLGFTALTAAGTYAFDKIAGEGRSTEDVLKEHEALIDRIKAAWPEAGKAAEGYRESVDILKADTRQQLEDWRALYRAAVADVSGQLQNLTDLQKLAAGQGQDVPGLAPLLGPIKEFFAAVAADTPSVRRFREEIAAIANQDPANAELQQLRNELTAGSAAAGDYETKIKGLTASIGMVGPAAAAEAAKFRQFNDALKTLASIAPPQLSDREEAQAAYEAATRAASGTRDRVRAYQELEAAIERIGVADQKAAASDSSRQRDREVTAIKGQQENVLKLIDDLDFEAMTMKMSAVDRQVEITLRQAGSAATAENRAQIEAKIRANYAEAAAQQKATEALDEARSVTSGFIEDFRQARESGEGFFSALEAAAQGLLKRLEDLLWQLIQIKLLGQTGTSSGGLLGGLVSSIFGGGGGLSAAATSAIAGAGAGLFHTGGKVGSTAVPMRMQPFGAFVNAPRFHDGLMPDEFRAILKRGEVVIPPGALAGADRAAGQRQQVDVRVETVPNKLFATVVETRVNTKLASYDRALPKRLAERQARGN
jgi:hypothetical protein